MNPLRIAESREERAVLVIRRAPLLASREEATSVEVQTISDLPPDMRTQVEVAQRATTDVSTEGKLLRRDATRDVHDATRSSIAIEHRSRALEHLDLIDIVEVT